MSSAINQDVYRADQLDADRAMLLLIDLQEKLLPLVPAHAAIVAATRTLVAGARLFGLPILATEQYPQGIGRTVEPVRRELNDAEARIMEKAAFSAWVEAAVREALLTIDRPQVILAGIESHVCIQQTALDLHSRDYDVFVCADAIGSRGKLDHEIALARMRQAGVMITTVESALFELCRRCDVQRFKPMLELIKSDQSNA